jgi:hypothetical protein
MSNEFLEYALYYASKGLKVFPLHPCSKRPLTKNGFKDASNYPDFIEEWWEENPDANIGIPTGRVNKFFVYDIDGEYPAELPALEVPYTVKTRKGYHVYLKYPDNHTIKTRTKINGHPVDIRSDGAYIVAPPSIHPEGGCYEFIN